MSLNNLTNSVGAGKTPKKSPKGNASSLIASVALATTLALGAGCSSGGKGAPSVGAGISGIDEGTTDENEGLSENMITEYTFTHQPTIFDEVSGTDAELPGPVDVVLTSNKPLLQSGTFLIATEDNTVITVSTDLPDGRVTRIQFSMSTIEGEGNIFAEVDYKSDDLDLESGLRRHPVLRQNGNITDVDFTAGQGIVEDQLNGFIIYDKGGAIDVKSVNTTNAEGTFRLLDEGFSSYL